MLDFLARDQIVLYPADSRALTTDPAHAPSGSLGGSTGVSSDGRDRGLSGGGTSNTPVAGSVAAGAISASAGNVGVYMLSQSYMGEDQIAQTTGGRAFYSTNDLAAALIKATEDGANYHSLSYSPTDREFIGKLHTIRVDLAQKGYTLAYRRAYYDLDPNAPATTGAAALTSLSQNLIQSQDQALQRTAGDTLSSYMQHGAPMTHSLIFGAHVEPAGASALGTAAQMADIAEQTYFFRTHKKGTALKSLPPVKLQQYIIDYTVMAHQLRSPGGGALNLEIAAAAFDADGSMLNAVVSKAVEDDDATPTTAQPKSYRAEQVLLAPWNATTIRMAVRDANTDRIGAWKSV